MRKDLEERLINRFKFLRLGKSLFKKFEIGEGWFNILWDLCEKIESELENFDKDIKDNFRVLRIKEKFGELRFEVNFEPGNVDIFIKEAEEMSVRICENCGREGEIKDLPWLQALCAGCRGDER